MEKKEIRKLTIVSGEGVRTFEVGVNNVFLIKDSSLEYDSSTEFLYSIEDKEGKLISSVENCPVVIDYK